MNVNLRNPGIEGGQSYLTKPEPRPLRRLISDYLTREAELAPI